MRKVSPVSSDRIRNMYVDRKVAVNNVTGTPPVDAIKPIKNSTTFMKDTYLLYSEAFYDKLKELKHHYKKFYQHQQQLEDSLDSYREREGKQALKDLKDLLVDLVHKFNHAYQSLKSLEEQLNTMEFSKKIEETLIQYQIPLSKVGITIDESFSLSFNQSILDNNLSFNADYILFLFDYENGLIRKLFNIFRGIKLPNRQSSRSYDIDANNGYPTTGMIVDKQL